LQFSFFLTGVEEEEEEEVEDEDEEGEKEKDKERGSFFGCSSFFSGIFFCPYRSLEVFALRFFCFVDCLMLLLLLLLYLFDYIMPSC
jgi:hypothetical protein